MAERKTLQEVNSSQTMWKNKLWEERRQLHDYLPQFILLINPDEEVNMILIVKVIISTFQKNHLKQS